MHMCVKDIFAQMREAAMKSGVINYPRDKSNCAEQDNRENHCQRPENPRPGLSFPDLLYGVVQGEGSGDCAQGSKHEGGHKTIQIWSPACMAETVNGRQQNQQEVNDGNEIRSCKG
jgi:hypothetical protein